MGAILDPQLSGAAGHNPGGIWRESRDPRDRHERDPALPCRVRRCRPGSGPSRHALRLRPPRRRAVLLRTHVAGIDHELHHRAVGENRVEWTIDVPEPELWWPHSLGEQPLHELSCELIVDGRARSSVLSHGVPHGPAPRLDTSRERGSSLHQGHRDVADHPTPWRCDTSPGRRRREGCPRRRARPDPLVAHIAHPEAYRTADELGMLVWQEMPLRG